MSEQTRGLQSAMGAYGTGLVPAGCPRCDWLYLVPTDQADTSCPHCGEATLTALEGESAELPYFQPPELKVPFAVKRGHIERAVEVFAQQIPYPPDDLNAAALAQRLRPLYLPMWLVDISARARWQAEVGFDYQVVSHRESIVNGQWSRRQFEETRINWEPRVGTLERRYENVRAPALAEHRPLLVRLGEFDLEKAVPYQGRDGAFFRLPNRLPRDAWSDAEPHVRQQAREECRRAAGADHIRDFGWDPRYGRQEWTQLLLPLYTTFYRDDQGQPQVVLVNGQSGRISGRRRASVEKARRRTVIVGIIALIIGFLGAIAGLATLFAPPLAVAAIPLLMVAVLVGLGAFYPLYQATQFNRTEAKEDAAALRHEAYAFRKP